MQNSLDVVHGVDSGLGIGLRSVTDESKATAATGVTVLDNNLGGEERLAEAQERYVSIGLTYGLLDGSELLELLAKSVLVCVPSEATVRVVSSWHGERKVSDVPDE